MRKNLEILDYEEKKTKAGLRYYRFKTSEGWMSCFDAKACEDLKKFEKTFACVEVMTAGDFQNIKKCYGPAEKDLENIDAGNEAEPEEKVPVEKPYKQVPQETQGYKPTSMYVSYAKDIFCNLVKPEMGDLNTQMTIAIKLVKQAEEAFR